jgi:hypothetical protein
MTTATSIDSPGKACACGRAYTRREFVALPRCGRDGDAGLIWRHCSCGSTLSLPVPVARPRFVRYGARGAVAMWIEPGLWEVLASPVRITRRSARRYVVTRPGREPVEAATLQAALDGVEP